MKRVVLYSLGLAALFASSIHAQPIVAEDDAGARYQLQENGSYGRLVQSEDGSRYLLRPDGSWDEAEITSASEETAQEEDMDEEVRELESASPPELGGEALDAELSRAVEEFVERQDPDADDEQQAQAVECLMDFLRPFEASEKRMLIGQPTLDAAFDLWADEGQPEIQDDIDQRVAQCTG